MKAKIEGLLSRLEEVETALGNPDVHSDKKKYTELSQEHSYLSELRESYQQFQKAEKELGKASSDFERFGGSRAQRDLLEFTYVNVLLRNGKKEYAHKTLLERRPNLYNSAPIEALSKSKI